MTRKKVKTSVLMTWIGQKGRETYVSFNFVNPDDEMRLAPVLQKFFEYCNPRKNVTILCHSFLQINNMKDKTSMTSSQN